MITIERLWIAALAAAGIVMHILLRVVAHTGPTGPVANAPLFAALLVGGVPLLWELLTKLFQGQGAADFLAGLAIISGVFLGEYLAATLVVLMLSGGEALEAFAVGRASSALRQLACRLPTFAHRLDGPRWSDVPLAEVRPGDRVVVLPHEICPVDGVVATGIGSMDESYLTGEPFEVRKAPGATVVSGAINGDAALTIEATRAAADSRYAQIMAIMQRAEEMRPRMRRLADALGAWYTPVAVAIALFAWVASGSPTRFLAVLVVATPCPLLIAIPVAIIGTISVAARRSILLRDPSVLEEIDGCRVAIFDKTGTLTHGRPAVDAIQPASGFDAEQLLRLVGSLERFSKHPLATAIVKAAEAAKVPLMDADEVREPPGAGLEGRVQGHRVQVTGRNRLASLDSAAAAALPPATTGLECVVLIDGRYAGLFRFRDAERTDGRAFVRHLGPKHAFDRVLLVSGDRAAAVQTLADRFGIREVFAEQQPEQKLALVQRETLRAKTLFVGDGVNDAPALAASSVGIAFGTNSDVTTEAARAVIVDSSLEKLDELLHLSQRCRRIAIESALGGMAASLIAVGFAAAGWLTPVAGALVQEAIDVAAVLNALRAAFPPAIRSDLRSR